MSTAVMERKLTRVGLHARCMEAAVHQPESWIVRVDGRPMPVYIEAIEDGSTLTVHFVAGPIPAGERYISLEFDGRPMHCAEMTFVPGQWWKHSLSTQFG